MKRLPLILLLLIPTWTWADDFEIKPIVSGLGVPWGMAFIDEDKILFSERAGKLGLLNVKTAEVRYLEEVPRVYARGQGGMLDVATPPGYKPGDWIYFTYSKKHQDRAVTVLARAKFKHSQLQDWQELIVTASASKTNRHFGSRIAFDNQGYLYFSVGDRGNRPNGQDLSTHAGTILRLNLDGTVPADNPFVDTDNAKAEIWSYGHRNPQGMAWDAANQRLWSIEHGPRGGDEINRIEKGKNYGWPTISHGKEYWGPVAVGEGTHKAGMEQPVKVYIPSIAPGSLIYYDGEAFPEWRGKLLAGALKLRHLNVITLDANGRAVAEDRLLEDLGERIRALLKGPQGRIYFSTDSGKVYLLKPIS